MYKLLISLFTIWYIGSIFILTHDDHKYKSKWEKRNSHHHYTLLSNLYSANLKYYDSLKMFQMLNDSLKEQQYQFKITQINLKIDSIENEFEFLSLTNGVSKENF